MERLQAYDFYCFPWFTCTRKRVVEAEPPFPKRIDGADVDAEANPVTPPVPGSVDAHPE
jgi:hypothetical protein